MREENKRIVVQLYKLEFSSYLNTTNTYARTLNPVWNYILLNSIVTTNQWLIELRILQVALDDFKVDIVMFGLGKLQIGSPYSNKRIIIIKLQIILLIIINKSFPLSALRH